MRRAVSHHLSFAMCAAMPSFPLPRRDTWSAGESQPFGAHIRVKLELSARTGFPLGAVEAHSVRRP
jgi:hypothetical protein